LSPKKSRKGGTEAVPPDLITAGLAGTGVLVAAYLALNRLLVATPLFCPEGSACAVVQGSRYMLLLGVPVSWLALLMFAVLGGVAALSQVGTRRTLVPILAAAAVGMSGYLTYVQGVALQAWCLYCVLVSLVSLGIAGRAVQLQLASRLPVQRAVLAGIAAALLAGAGLPAYIHAQPAAAATLDLETFEGRLAVHLAAAGARFYGTYWCPACSRQKELFGPAAVALPYIECDPRGARARPEACQAAGVRAYPTWIFPDGARFEGVISLDQLARISGLR